MDDRTKILTALSVALEALERHHEEHTDTWLVKTPRRWGLDPDSDGVCSGKELIKKLREIEGDALERSLSSTMKRQRLEER